MVQRFKRRNGSFIIISAICVLTLLILAFDFSRLTSNQLNLTFLERKFEGNQFSQEECKLRGKILDSFFTKPNDYSLLRSALFEGNCLLSNQQIEALSKQLSSVNALDPITSWFVGSTFFSAGHVQEARKYWESGNLSELYISRAEQLIAFGDIAESLQIISLIQKIDPSIPLGWLYGKIAFFYMQKENWESVYHVCLRSLDFDAKDAETHYWCGVGLSGMGQPNQAIDELHLAIELGFNSWANYHLAKIYLWLGQTEEAVCHLALSEDLNTNSGSFQLSISSDTQDHILQATTLPSQQFNIGSWSTLEEVEDQYSKYQCIADLCRSYLINSGIRVPEKYWETTIQACRNHP